MRRFVITAAMLGSISGLTAAGPASAHTLRSFAPGDVVYPTGQRDGVWWQVDDENGNRGWVSSATISPR